jgi:hypothetical protein
MKPLTHQINSNQSDQIKCFFIFLILIVPALYWNHQLEHSHRSVSRFILFITGWLTWTFAEYIMHRFWNHSKSADNNSSIIRRHHHHHTHPTEIKITGTQRLWMVVIAIALFVVSVWTDSYLYSLAGAWTGFFWFFQMHYILHQTWARKIFPTMVRYHIVHHCKQPDRCFGISTIIWDAVFGTVPDKQLYISARIIDFYFGHH